MKTARSAALIYALVVLSLVRGPALSAQQPAAAGASFTFEQMEAFLLNARVVSSREVSTGINNTRRATLSDGSLTHDAHIQTVDVSKFVFTPAKGPTELNFKDTYRYNIAGYRFARLLGLDHVPVSVERRLDGKAGSITWWVDDVRMDEKQRQKGSPSEWPPARTSAQVHLMRVFDALIANVDRNMGNLLWTSDGTMWMIDHTRSFRLNEKVPAPATLVRCERNILNGMRTLTLESIKAAVQNSLTDEEIKAVLKRRDQIVALFDSKIAERGEAAILYTLAPATK